MEIQLSHDDEKETWRITRLEAVKDSIQSHIGLNVLALHDHEGELTVRWHGRPNEWQMMIVDSIWKDLNEVVVEHIECQIEIRDIGKVE